MAKIGGFWGVFRGRRSANSVNRPQIMGAIDFFSAATTRKKYSDTYFWLIASRIFRGLQNVRFMTDPAMGGAVAEAKLAALLRFVNANLQPMVWQLWQNGMIVLDEMESDKWRLVPYTELRFDGNGAVTNFRYVVYSDVYMYIGKSDIQVVRENMNAIDTYKNSDIYLTKTFGAFGILSGREMGINAADKEELQQELKSRAGTTEAKDQFIITNSALDFHQIDFKIKDLQLPEKIKDEVMTLAGYFGVPYDLLPMSGKSTYANQEQAIVDFYRNCITPLAEVVLSLLRYIVLKKYVVIPTAAVTFGIDNVAELADDKSAKIDYKTKVADLAAKVRDMGMGVPEYMTQEINEEI